MLTLPPAKHPGKRQPVRPASAVAPLVLVWATYEPDGPAINLRFDRAIDIDGIDVTQFTVLDGTEIGCRWTGYASTRIDVDWVQVQLLRGADYSGPDVVMTAGPGNGIIASDDGAAWEGVTDLVLPWP